MVDGGATRRGGRAWIIHDGCGGRARPSWERRLPAGPGCLTRPGERQLGRPGGLPAGSRRSQGLRLVNNPG